MRGYTGIFIFCLAVAGIGCVNIKLKKEFELDRADWYTEGASALRQHEALTRVDPPLIEMWRYDAAAGVGSGGALIADSVVFFGNRKGMIHALNLADGRRLGRKRFDAPIEASMVLTDTVLYVPLGLDKKSLVAWNIVNGSKVWVRDGLPIEAGLLRADTSVFAVDVGAEVFALGASTGDVIWQKKLGDNVTVLASPVVVGTTLIVIHEEGGVFGLDKETGVERWYRKLPAPVYNTPAANGEFVFIPTTRGSFVALEAQMGRVAWTYKVDDKTMRFSPPALISELDHVVVGGTDNIIRTLNARDGALIWQSDVEAATNTAPLVTQNTIYIGTLRSKLFALDKITGASIWDYELTGRVKSAIAAYDGRLVVMAETQQVIMFAPDTSSVGLAIRE